MTLVVAAATVHHGRYGLFWAAPLAILVLVAVVVHLLTRDLRDL